MRRRVWASSIPGARLSDELLRKNTLHWKTDDGRSGTVLPHKLDDWPSLREFLKRTGAKHVFAYTVTADGDHVVYEEGD